MWGQVFIILKQMWLSLFLSLQKVSLRLISITIPQLIMFTIFLRLIKCIQTNKWKVLLFAMEFQRHGFLKYLLFVAMKQYITAQRLLAMLFHVLVTVFNVIVQLIAQLVIRILIMLMVLVFNLFLTVHINVQMELILIRPNLFVIYVQAIVYLAIIQLFV